MLEAAEMFEKHIYKEALEQASSFNTRLLVERQSRLPFLDTQTNIAQVDCKLWRSKCERVEPLQNGQEYSYQVRYWKKLPKVKKVVRDETTGEEKETEEQAQPTTVTGGAVVFKQELIPDEGMDTSPSEPTPEELSPSSDDYDYYADRKRKRQSRNSRRTKVDNLRRGSRSRKSSVIGTRNSGRKVEDVDPDPAPLSDPTAKQPGTPGPTEPETDPGAAPEVTIKSEPGQAAAPNKGKKSGVCDVCGGDNSKNKNTGLAEEMVSCVDCGRSAHPSCLQFEGQLADTVKQYNWQCLECKSCSICGTSDNDDQLLFCDECDRGFHMYCLKPKIERPPEGSWVCHMCKK